MRMSNVLMVAIAFVCAVAAALLARVWLVSQSAQAPINTEVAAPAPLRSIVVTNKDLQYGDKLTSDTVKLVPWLGEKLPKGAFLSKKALFGAGESRVALHSMAEGEAVLLHKLLGGASSNALSARLGESMKAVTIRVNDVAGMAGLVQPDDRVDVLLTYAKSVPSETARVNTASSSIVVLLQKIRVLAIDQATQRKDKASPPKAVTLEVSTEDAQRLVLGARIGELSLMLNGIADASGRQPTETVSTDDLIAADRGVLEKAPAAEVKSARPALPTVTVTRSTDRKSYQVQDDQRRDEYWQHEVLNHQGSPVTPGQ